MKYKYYCSIMIAFALILTPAITMAHCKGAHAGQRDCETHDHDSGGKGGKVGGNLEATFCLDIVSDATSELSMESDGMAIGGYQYCDDKNQKVSVVTGKGPGFNFETYTRNGGSWTRSVKINCSAGGSIALADDFGEALNPLLCGENYNLTFRFDQDEGALDLGSLANPEDSGLVSIFASLTNANGNRWMFAHGTVPSPGTSGHLAQNPCVVGTDDLLVTRKEGNTWWFEHSGEVCLWDTDSGLEFQEGTRVYLDYTFKLDQE
jgi:hypothetical protein